MEQTKTVRPRNWLYELLVCLEILLILAIWWILTESRQKAFLFGALTYFSLAWPLRLTLQWNHRKGIQFFQRRNYKEAATAFQKSFDFFSVHPWIDKYRFVTMFSTSALPYQQMALNNMGLCYLYMGENEKALQSLHKLAQMNSSYPNIAKTIEEIQKHINEEATH